MSAKRKRARDAGRRELRVEQAPAVNPRKQWQHGTSPKARRTAREGAVLIDRAVEGARMGKPHATRNTRGAGTWYPIWRLPDNRQSAWL